MEPWTLVHCVRPLGQRGLQFSGSSLVELEEQNSLIWTRVRIPVKVALFSLLTADYEPNAYT